MDKIQKYALGSCAGLSAMALIFISIMLVVPDLPLVSTTTPVSTTPAPAECLFSAVKITKMETLTFCYDDKRNERLGIYCNGTAINWDRDAIRRVAKFLKRVFETMEPLEQKKGYHFELIPYMNLRFENGLLRYAILEQKCRVTPFAVYTMYHWLCY